MRFREHDDDGPVLDINAVLEHYDSPIKTRRAYNTSCPLHEDRGPSCSVNTEKGVWKCHSCGQGGDGYTLIRLMEKEVTDFAGAREFAKTTLGLAEGGTGRGGSDVLDGAYVPGWSSRGSRPQRQGDRPKRGGYIPAWRRK